jgi:hypothetical protein
MCKNNLKGFLSLVALATILIFAPQTSAQFDLHLSPLLVEVDLAPGVTKSYKLHLANEDKQNSVTIRAYPSDMIESQQGAYKVADKGTSEWSCADWIQLSDSNFTLEPGGGKDVEVKIKAPRDAFGGRYAAVVFEVVPREEPAGKELGSVTIHFRLPSFVEVTVKRFGGLQRKATITDFRVAPFSNEKLEKEIGGEALSFTASVKNEGNIHIKGTGTLIIKDKEGRTKRRVPLGGGRGSVIPGATVDFQSLLRRPFPGEYTARAMINFGGLSPSVAEIPFSVARAKSSALGSFKASSYIALDIKPEHLEMKTPPRSFRAVTFSLRNDEPDTVEVKVYLMDLGYDPEGDLVALDSSETGHSCREWISLEPEKLILAPEKSDQVKLTLKAPPQGEGGYYACVIFDALLKGTKEGAISTPFQIPVILSVPTNLDQKGEIVDLQIEASAGKPALLTAYFKNTGNVHSKPKGKISLELIRQIKSTEDMIYVGKPQSEKVGEFFFEEVEQYVLPGGIRKMEADYPGALEAGQYLAEITIDYGGSEPAKFEKKFRVK